MAVSVTAAVDTKNSAAVLSVTEITLGTYITGGVVVTPAQLGLEKVSFASVTAKTLCTACFAYMFHYIVSSNKIMAFTSTGELANGTATPALILQVIAYE